MREFHGGWQDAKPLTVSSHLNFPSADQLGGWESKGELDQGDNHQPSVVTQPSYHN